MSSEDEQTLWSESVNSQSIDHQHPARIHRYSLPVPATVCGFLKIPSATKPQFQHKLVRFTARMIPTHHAKS